jgi:glycosyltransferase involved in cell wall biosynthesis
MNKLLFVCYDGYKTTNTRVRCYRFSAELNKQGLNTEVFSFKDSLNARYDGFESSRSSALERISLLMRATGKLLREDRTTAFYIQKAGYFALAPLIVSLLKGNRLILDYDDYEYEQSPISSWLLRLLCKRANFCVAASSYLQEFLGKFSSSVYYIPTGVDTDIFRPKKTRQGKETVFAWVGFVVDKDAADNLRYIIDCFDGLTRKHHEARLEIVGGGVRIEELVSHIRGLRNKNVLYKGVLTPDKIPSYLDEVDVGLFILTKHTRYNRSKSPTKLFEYMAKGLAVISTEVGESGKVIVDGQNGLIAETSSKMGEKAELLIRNRGLIKKLGKNAVSTAQKAYSLDILGRRLASIIKKELPDD